MFAAGKNLRLKGKIEFGHEKSMVRGSVAGSGPRVDPGGPGSFGQGSCGQDIVDTPPHLSFEGIGGSVVPECVVPPLRLMLSKDVYLPPV